ncbi:hypothetical protein BDN72DRAFT_966000 [Pluteus cervinus]|uniref:Uncharacterized protein n=1 Tax=Pluteus cervinus TaxID=181527 RepID=A0ACD3A1L6_9AGAR|nr:hypothetical protein BDN72DRAFT_966000 [Pluteus cervinus]
MSPELSPPIARLPPEMLIAIFLAARQIIPRKSFTILTISWVCQHWRTIALATPELWECIDTLNINAIRNSIIRARDRPLSIFLAILQHHNRQPVLDVLKSLPRTVTLRLVASHEDDFTRMRQFIEMTAPAPVLEILQLDALDLPKNMFSGHLPSLRRLSLSFMSLRLEHIPECPQLRSLRVANTDKPIPVIKLIQLLPAFPLLETLEIRCIFWNRPGVNVNLPGSPAELPNLRVLDLAFEDMHNTVALLKHLRLPTTCIIKLDCAQKHQDEHISLISALFVCRTSTPAVIKKIKISTESGVDLKVTERVVEDVQRSTTQGPNLDVQFWPYNLRPYPTVRMATQICQHHLDLDNLETLDLTCKFWKDQISQSFWEFVDLLPHLRTLKIRCIYVESFIDYISESIAFQSTNMSRPRFSAINKLVYEEDPGCDAEPFNLRLITLMEYLRIRMNKGFPLETLKFVRQEWEQEWIEIPEEILEGLKEVVQKLTRVVKIQKITHWDNYFDDY